MADRTEDPSQAGRAPRPAPAFGEYASDADRPGAGGPEHRPGTPEQGEQPPAAGERPRPAFGEYAPEGWEWKPEGEAAHSQSAPAAASAPASPAASPVQGVPHNLGVGSPGSAPRGATGAAPTSEPAPYRADAPAPGQGRTGVEQSQQPQQQPQPQQPRYQQGAGQSKPRLGDRIVTIALLVLGAIGALNFAGSLMVLPSQVGVTAAALGIEDAKIPGWVGVLGTVSAIAMLALFALTAIFSIQRMRAGRISFWIPLVAGVVALIAFVVIVNVATFGVPELVQHIQSDPQGALDQLLKGTPSG